MRKDLTRTAPTALVLLAALALLAAGLPAYPADNASGQKPFKGTCTACQQFQVRQAE